MTVHPLRRPATPSATPLARRVPTPRTGSVPAPVVAPLAAPARVSVPAAVLDALGAPAPDRQGPPAARVPVSLLLSLAGRCACDDCVQEYTDDARRNRLRAVSA